MCSSWSHTQLTPQNTYIWLSSRAMLGMSLSGAAPKVFSRCTKHGVPYVAVAASSSLGGLAYLCQSAFLTFFFGVLTYRLSQRRSHAGVYVT